MYIRKNNFIWWKYWTGKRKNEKASLLMMKIWNKKRYRQLFHFILNRKTEQIHQSCYRESFHVLYLFQIKPVEQCSYYCAVCLYGYDGSFFRLVSRKQFVKVFALRCDDTAMRSKSGVVAALKSDVGMLLVFVKSRKWLERRRRRKWREWRQRRGICTMNFSKSKSGYILILKIN